MPRVSKLKVLVAGLAAFLPFAGDADAGTINLGTIRELGVAFSGNLAYVVFTTNLVTPACSSPTWQNAFVFDHSTARGKAVLSVLTAAYLSGKRISATGAGTCTSLSGHGFPAPPVNVENLGGLNVAN